MNLSALTLGQLVVELSPQVTRRLIRGAFLIDRHDLYLDLGDAGYLLLSAHPVRGRMLFAHPPKSAEQTPLSWADQFLVKSGILGIHQVPHERIIEFTLTKRDRLGSATETRLICELIGRYANVIAVDAQSGKILGALRQITARQNRVRAILPGRTYLPPPTFDRVPPSDVTAEKLLSVFRAGTEDPVEVLVKSIAGLDHLTAREIAFRSRYTVPKTNPDFEPLATTARQFLANPPFLDGAAIANYATNKHALTVLDLQHVALGKTYPTIGEAIIAQIAKEGTRDHLQGRTKNIERELQGQCDTLMRKIERMEGDLEKAAHADEYEKFGNVLMAHLTRVPPGANSVRLPDVFANNATEIEIPLNPKRTPSDNARDYLKRSRKARKGMPILARRLATAKARAREIEGHLGHLARLTTEEDLDAFRAELTSKGWLKEKPAKQSKQKQKRANGDIHPRRYRTAEGWLVLVGRNNKENDRLTKGAAREDLFFHAQGCPGSHVILKREGRAENPSRATLKEAASLAAFWSKARGAKSVPVNYTEVRYVQKPRGAPPGLVTIRNEKTLMVEPREMPREDEKA